jgi:hypothetical protein
MRHRVLCMALLIAAVLIPLVSSQGQGKNFGDAGIAEIAGSVSFSSFTPVSNGKTGDATTLLSFGPQFGYFVARGFELGFSPGMALLPGISYVTPSEGDATTILQLFVFPAYNYHAPGSNAVPFIQIPLGYTSMSQGGYTDSGFSWGVKGGVKIIAEGQLLVTVYGEYLQLSFTPEKATERAGFNYLSFGVSVGGFF